MTANMSSRQDRPVPTDAPLRSLDLMREMQEEVRSERRRRLLKQGASQVLADPAIFEAVEEILRRGIAERPDGGLFLPDLLSDEEEWLLDNKPLAITSHRKIVGPIIVFLKRRIALPITRWLYEYMFDNLRRQQRINALLFACIEELAIENARLRHDVGRTGDPQDSAAG
jgi:hypothetical protein